VYILKYPGHDYAELVDAVDCRTARLQRLDLERALPFAKLNPDDVRVPLGSSYAAR